jgi:hypothetical protein
MRTLLRTLAAVLLGLCAVLPVLGGDECGGGEGGVWILPRSSVMTNGGGRGRVLGLARGTKTFPTLLKSIDLQLSGELGAAAAMMSVSETNTTVQLPIIGHVLHLSSAMLQQMSASGVQSADIVVSDENGSGYLMLLVFGNGGATLYVF